MINSIYCEVKTAKYISDKILAQKKKSNDNGKEGSENICLVKNLDINKITRNESVKIPKSAGDNKSKNKPPSSSHQTASSSLLIKINDKPIINIKLGNECSKESKGINADCKITMKMMRIK